MSLSGCCFRNRPGCSSSSDRWRGRRGGQWHHDVVEVLDRHALPCWPKRQPRRALQQLQRARSPHQSSLQSPLCERRPKRVAAEAFDRSRHSARTSSPARRSSAAYRVRFSMIDAFERSRSATMSSRGRVGRLGAGSCSRNGHSLSRISAGSTRRGGLPCARLPHRSWP